MKRIATALFAVCFAVPLFAQNPRTFVSGTGVDTGSTCGASAPCRSFAYALSVTVHEDPSLVDPNCLIAKLTNQST